MKEQILKRSVSCILTLCMLFLMLPVISLDVNAVGGEDLFQLDADCQVLKFVDEEVFNAADHVARLPEEETLDSYAFLNRDGSKTVYFLNQNAKYYDATGAVKEKNIDLVAGLNAYTVTQNDVQLSIPTDPASGIDLTYADYDVSLIPQGGSSTMVQHTDNSVGYINYYGKGTALLYTPTYSGIKEDILLAAYTGISSFTFLLNTDGLRLYSQNGRYFLAASEDSDMQIRLGDVVAYDAQCNMSRGTLTATAITEGQQYLLTVSVDESFLTDESTVYPVVIDPTMTVSDETHGSNAIEDAPLFSGYATTNHGSYIYNRVGYVDSNYGVGRTVIRPTGLLNSSVYQNLSIDQIASATFHIRDASGSGSATVNLYPLNNSTWTESGVTWNNVGYHSSVSYATASVGGNAMAAFDITSLVGEWKLGIKNPQCGFILINANESTSQRALVSSEGAVGAPGYYPYIALTYTNYTNDSVSVREGYSKALNTSGLSGSITWTVNNPSVATVSASGVVTGVKAGKTYVTAWINGVEAKSYAIYVIIPDGLYYIQNLDAEYYLGVEDGVFSSNAKLELQNKATSGYAKLQQLWNVKYVNNGTYEISALFYDDPCLRYNGGQVSLGTDNSVLHHWMISYADRGYRIQKMLVDDAYLCPEDSCVSIGTTICTDSIANVGSSTLWGFERQTNVVGVALCDTNTQTYATSSTVKYVPQGSTATLNTLGLQYYFYSGNTYETQHAWSSNKHSVATVISNTGAVTGVQGGEATITISVDDDSGDCLTANFRLVVVDSVYDYVVNIEYGQTKTLAQLGLTDFINQANTGGQALTWHSSDESIVSVSSSGEVTANSGGSVIITAKASNRTILTYNLKVVKNVYYITNFYDSSFADNQVYIDNIATAINFLNIAYTKMFVTENNSFAFNIKNMPSLDNDNPLDLCDNTANCDCASKEDHTSHHKSMEHISDHFMGASHCREENEIIVFWTDRDASTLCTLDEYNEHIYATRTTLAAVANHRPIIYMIAPYGETAAERTMSMCLVLVHEMAHVFGMDDVNKSTAHCPKDSNGNSERCVMEFYEDVKKYETEFFNDILSGEDNAYCSSCEPYVRAHLGTINSSEDYVEYLSLSEVISQ